MDAWVRGEPGARAAQKTQPQLPSSLLRVEDTTTTATTSEQPRHDHPAAIHNEEIAEEERYLQRMLQANSMSMSMRMLRSRVDTEEKQDVAADLTEESERYFGRTLQTTSMSMSMNLNLSIIFPPIDV